MSFLSAALVAATVSGGVSTAEPAQATPPNANVVTLEMLAREGYEIKAIQSATERGFGFVVMMQRGANIRTCLMRIIQGADGRPGRESICF